MRVLGENEMKLNTRMPQNVRLSEWLSITAILCFKGCDLNISVFLLG